MRVIKTSDIFGAAREYLDSTGYRENWEGGNEDFSDLAEGVDGISPAEDGEAPRLPFSSEAIPTEVETVYTPPVKKPLTKGRRVVA